MFFPIPAMLAGDPTRSALQTSQMSIDQAGERAAGRAIMEMFNPPVPGAQQMTPAPGQPSMPMRPPMGVAQAQMGGNMPFAAGGAPMSAPAPMARPMGGSPPMPQMAGPQGGGMPQQAGMLQQGVMPQQGGGAAGGPLTWQQIVQGVVRTNPGEKNPAVIAAAVNRLLPLMAADSQQQWRAIQLQIRQQMADIAQQRADTQGNLGQQRIDTQRYGIDTRADTEADKEAGRGERGKQASEDRRAREAGVESRFERREDRIKTIQQVHADQSFQRLEQSRQRLEMQMKQGEARQNLAQWRAVLDAQHKRAMEIIQSQSAGMGAKERQQLIDEENAAYMGAIVRMRSQMEGGQQQGQSGAQTPTKVKTPEEAQKLAPGTKYVTPDGQEFTR